VIAGEVVALNDSGHPDFNLLQNFRSAASHIHYFVFDLLIHKGRDLTWLTPVERREIMRSALTFRSSRVRISDYVEASAADMLAAVRAQGLEGSSARKTASTSPASAAARG
jgi:bifunctional non-homologous end joining protein LigD